jgi:hypothetical protein
MKYSGMTPTMLDKEKVKRLKLYKETDSLREEILKHKWIESQKVGYDIGIYKATMDWLEKHYTQWKKHREKQN